MKLPLFDTKTTPRPTTRGLTFDRLIPGKIYSLTSYHQGSRSYRTHKALFQGLHGTTANFIFRIGRSSVTDRLFLKGAHLVQPPRLLPVGTKTWKVVIR